MSVAKMIYTGHSTPRFEKGNVILQNLALIFAVMRNLGEYLGGSEIEPDGEYYIVLEHGVWFFDEG